jgi:glycosyltransferase involved in cell wall biosynthesis
MLREAVDSVFAQARADFELIIVDDGSTDETAAGLQRMAGTCRVITQERRGPAAARNRGAGAASGRYLAFLDSDDLWLPEKLAVQLAFMTAHPQVAVCQTEEIWVRDGVRVTPKLKHRKPDGDIFKRSLELCLVSPSAVMMTRDLFIEVGGFDENLLVCEDYDLWLRIGVDHAVPLVPQPLVIKRGGHRDQLSRALWGMDRFRVAALRKLLRSGLSGERRDWAVAALRRKVAVLANGARKRRRENEALAYEAILQEFDRHDEELHHEPGTNQRIRQEPGISPEGARAIVGMGSQRSNQTEPARREPTDQRESSARSHGLAGRDCAAG